MRSFIGLVLLFIISSCGTKKSLIVNERDFEFYQRFVNPASQSAGVENKLQQVKLVETGKEYPMRFVLFNDNTFYYQIDKLGRGSGRWVYQNGSLEMNAERPFFDMTLYLSAAKAEGDDVVFRFIDRHGVQTAAAGLRAPAPVAPPLEAFTESAKGY